MQQGVASRGPSRPLKALTYRTANAWVLVIIAVAASALACTDPGEDFDLQLAMHHAPIVYQDTDDSDAAADFITAFTYDGNQIADDNWDNFSSRRGVLYSRVYYSVVETELYWFLTYSFFHPRDWTDHSFDQEHENDFEGLLAIVRKDGSRFGQLLGIVTVFHLDFYSFVPNGSPLTDGSEDIDGTLTLQAWGGSRHPVVSIEAKGHGVKAWPFAGDFSGSAQEDGVIYRPRTPGSSEPSLPSSGNDRDVQYLLIDVRTTLWSRQLSEALVSRSAADTFATWGTLKGNESGSCGDGITVTCSEDSAHLPWAWDDGDDDVANAVLALDPSILADVYFNGFTYESSYMANVFLRDLKTRGFNAGNLPRGWPSSLNISQLLLKVP